MPPLFEVGESDDHPNYLGIPTLPLATIAGITWTFVGLNADSRGHGTLYRD